MTNTRILQYVKQFGQLLLASFAAFLTMLMTLPLVALATPFVLLKGGQRWSSGNQGGSFQSNSREPGKRAEIIDGHVIR